VLINFVKGLVTSIKESYQLNQKENVENFNVKTDASKLQNYITKSNG